MDCPFPPLKIALGMDNLDPHQMHGHWAHSHISKRTCPNLTKFSVHVRPTCGRGRSSSYDSAVCTSGFVDDVIFSFLFAYLLPVLSFR